MAFSAAVSLQANVIGDVLVLLTLASGLVLLKIQDLLGWGIFMIPLRKLFIFEQPIFDFSKGYWCLTRPAISGTQPGLLQSVAVLTQYLMLAPSIVLTSVGFFTLISKLNTNTADFDGLLSM